jgi:hypothetical protein
MTHTVTVTTRVEDEGTPNEFRVIESITFKCDAPQDADCRRWPDCGCESWEWNEAGTHDQNEHERVPGQKCWLTDWFDAEGAIYVGDDYDDMRADCVPAIDRTGEITVAWSDEWPEWTFLPEPGDPS